MRRFAVLLLALGACGRLDYESLPGADAQIEPPLSEPFGPPEIVSDLSEIGPGEEDPSLRADRLEIVFDGFGDALLTAHRNAVDQPWLAPQPIAETASKGSETSPEISPDGLVMFFSSTRNTASGAGNIYMTTRPTHVDAWAAPTRVVELSSDASEIAVAFNASLTFIVFESKRVGGLGESDLYLSKRASVTDAWGAPVLLTELSSTGNDIAPFYHEPTDTLWFASNRAGSLDLYTAKRQPDGRFADPAPVAELNDGERQSDPWLSPDGSILYLSQTRGGETDIYRATR